MTTGKQCAVPRLRFPTFKEAWEEKPLSSVATNLDNQRVPITEGDRVKGNIPYYGASGIVDYIDAFIFNEDLLCISEDGANLVARSTPIAFPVSGKAWVNNHAHVLRFESKKLQKIVENYLNFISLEDYLTGMAQPKLNRAMLDSILVPVPRSEKEQQEVADCLSSLEVNIGAENDRLNALKAHKQGLMKKLFPAQGQQPPDARFPEFERAWDVANLGDVSVIVRGGSPRPIEGYFTRSADGLNWLKIGDVHKESKYIERTAEKVIPAALSKTRQIHPGDLILSNSMSFGRPYISKIVSCIHDGWIAITGIQEKLAPEFLYYVLGSDVSQVYFQSLAAGSGVKNLNASSIKLLPIGFPDRIEQRKISDCFSCLDDLISSHSRKIATLKQHKMGLLQQLFPTVSEHAT